MARRLTRKRILALDPISKGFGFAVLEGADILVDWGVVYAKEAHFQKRLRDLLGRYDPEIVVLEDMEKNRRRGALGRRTCSLARATALEYSQVYNVSTRRVIEIFRNSGSSTKYEIASSLVNHFPQLRRHQPKVRKPWQSESVTMAIFDAVAFAVTYIGEFEPKVNSILGEHESTGLGD